VKFRAKRHVRFLAGVAAAAVAVIVVIFVVVPDWHLVAGGVGAGSGPDPPMEVQLNLNRGSGAAPLPVHFWTNVTGGTPPYTYDVEFGDGGEANNTSAGKYVYNHPGNFTAEVQVTDSDNVTAIAVAHVRVCCVQSPPHSSTFPLAFYAFDPDTVRAIVALSGYLQAGDYCYLADGNGNGTAHAERLNGWAEEINAAEPECTLVAQTAKLSNVQLLLSGGLSPLFSQVSLEVTPASDNSTDQGQYLEELQNASLDIKADGLTPDTYVTGRGLQSVWDDALFAPYVNRVVIETQRHCVIGEDFDCLENVAGQFNASGAPISKLAFQATIGLDNESAILSTFNLSMAIGTGFYFFEFNDADSWTLAQILLAMGR
jgi:hypothetical protein